MNVKTISLSILSVAEKVYRKIVIELVKITDSRISKDQGGMYQVNEEMSESFEI